MAHERSPLRRLADAYHLERRLEAVRRGVRSRFEVDTRALAAVRISLGLLLLVDLLHRARYLETFYTDDGVYPLAAYEITYTRFNGLSLHALSGDLWFQQLLFLVAGALAIALIAGYRTKLVALLSLVLLLSLHGRNPAVLNGGDRLFRVLLFVALWSPLGERWSIDAVRRGEHRERVVGFATAALLVQPIVVFTSNAILKHDGDTWYAGDALEIALNNDVMTIAVGNHLGNYPSLLTVLTYAWVVLLAGSAAFLLLPTGRLRAVVAFAYLGAFAGMATAMAVGLFPFLLAASVLPFLTTPFWDALSRRVPARLRVAPIPTSRLGLLGKPPVERRLLAVARRRGHESAASFAVAYGRSLVTIVAALVLVWILLFSADYATGFDVPEAADEPFLDEQRWGLYAPDPSQSYSWYAVEATLADGSTVDAFGGGNVSADRPPDAAAEYETFRHRKFMSAVRSSGSDGIIAESYAEWACANAAVEPIEDVESVTVVRFIDSIPVEDDGPNRLTVVERAC